MDEETLFKHLKKQKKELLLDLLKSAFSEMDSEQKRLVFEKEVNKIKPSKIDKEDIIDKVTDFYDESLAGLYYAPFSINSKNFSHVPEETEEWFEKLNDLLILCTQLSKQDEHIAAVEFFSTLYSLIEKMENGEEIIFSEEYGMWMLPGDEKKYIQAYILSLAKVKQPKEYSEAIIHLIKRDSFMSFTNGVYKKAIEVANENQINYLMTEIKKQNIRTESKY